VFHRYTEYICQEGNIFSICCCPDEFLLDLLNIILTVIFCLAPVTDFYPSHDVAYDMRAFDPAVTLVQEGKGPPSINLSGNSCDTC
jgi:hypothetical protein